jgi:hypothetical protein
MKKKAFLLSLFVMTIVIYSCKKEKEPEPTPVPVVTTYPNYSQLKVGNYWVYQRFDIDTYGNATPKSIYDSCYVQTDTIMNGKTYFKVVEPDPNLSSQRDISFLRDSLHYIVNNYGMILFSSQDFSSIFLSRYMLSGPDTLCLNIRKMSDQGMAVITPAGTFMTIDAIDTYYMYPDYTLAGNPRYRHTRYSENIGIVVKTLAFYLHNPNYFERRLIRYHLN